MAYSYKNSKGETYYLNESTVTLRGGMPKTIYFFTKKPNPARGVPCDLPEGREVVENPRNGFLTVKRKDSAWSARY